MEGRSSFSRPIVSSDFLMGAFLAGLLAILLLALPSRESRTERLEGEGLFPDGGVPPHEIEEPHVETVWRGVPTA